MSSCGPQASAIISPSGFRVRIMERKKTSPQIAIKNHRVKFWTSGTVMSTGQDFTPKLYPPCPPSASQIKDVLLSMDFFISTGKLPQEQSGSDPKSHLNTQSKTNSLCLLQMLLCLYCWGIAPASPFMPGSSQTSTISSNFCGHVNMTESMEDMKSIQSKAQMLMAWIHIGWTVKGKVVKMWEVLFWRLHSSEIDIKAILQIKISNVICNGMSIFLWRREIILKEMF